MQVSVEKLLICKTLSLLKFIWVFLYTIYRSMTDRGNKEFGTSLSASAVARISEVVKKLLNQIVSGFFSWTI